jgi:hypothetical protein
VTPVFSYSVFGWIGLPKTDIGFENRQQIDPIGRSPSM